MTNAHEETLSLKTGSLKLSYKTLSPALSLKTGRGSLKFIPSPSQGEGEGEVLLITYPALYYFHLRHPLHIKYLRQPFQLIGKNLLFTQKTNNKSKLLIPIQVKTKIKVYYLNLVLSTTTK